MAVLEFFETSGRNLLPAEAAAGVRHHVALSIVGIDRTDNGYFRAKVAQEKLIVASGIPYTIIRATQFLELVGGIAGSRADGTSSGCFGVSNPAQFARTRRIYSFIRVIRRDESPRRTVQYPPFGGRRPDFGSLIASGSDPSGTSDLEFSALRPYCQRAHGQRSLLASLGQNSTGALVPSSPSLRLLRTYLDIGARMP
jgi:hypothetical protein